MSKSLGNYIGISESAKDIYGKTLSVPDNVIYEYFELTTDVPQEELTAIKAMLEGPSQNPRDIKRRLARELVALYYSQEEALKAEHEFDNIFIKKQKPDVIKEFTLETGEAVVGIVTLLATSGMVSSNSEARRLIQGGGVSIDGKKIMNIRQEVSLDNPFVLKLGKRRFLKILPKVG